MATYSKSSRFWFFVIVGIVVIVLPALSLFSRPTWREYGIHGLKGITNSLTDGTLGGSSERNEYIAICVAIKDQGHDLPEFLQHHHYNMGINRFYLLDDGSTPPLATLVDTYGVPPEILTFVYYEASQRVQNMQLKMYDDAAAMFGANHTWLAYIDADEFFDTPGGETMDSIMRSLDPLKHVGALGVNWQMHTSNGQLTRPESTIAAYTECIFDDPAHNGDGSDNKHIKSIVRAKNYGKPLNPHKFSTTDNTVTVGEYGDVIDHYAFRQPISRQRISLHHYAVKSRAEFEQKINRSNAMGSAKSWGFWDHVETDLPHVPCTEMVRWLEQ